MSQFLRDATIKNINVDESLLKALNLFFISKANKLNNSLPDIDGNVKKRLIVSYIIRFVQKSYRFYDFQEILKFFNQASKVERIILTCESIESVNSNRNIGSSLELKLDALDINNCSLIVSSDDDTWVHSIFTGIIELLNQHHNKSGLVKNNWTYLLVQIFGVIFVFVFSLWAAIKLTPFLKLENAFVISFLFIFLIFSNSWTFINLQITKVLNHYFPNLRFKRKNKDTIHWLIQTIIGGLVVAATLFLLNKLFEFVGSVLSGFVK